MSLASSSSSFVSTATLAASSCSSSSSGSLLFSSTSSSFHLLRRSTASLLRPTRSSTLDVGLRLGLKHTGASFHRLACSHAELPSQRERRSAALHLARSAPLPPTSRLLSSTPSRAEARAAASEPLQKAEEEQQEVLATYAGPLHKTFRRLKVFSLSSLVFASVLTPYLLLGPGALDTFARFALVLTALSASGASTALISWIGKPYVGTLELVQTKGQGQGQGRVRGTKEAQNNSDPLPPSDTRLVAHTTSWRLQPLRTTIYQPSYIRGTSRPFAQWQLAADPPALPIADPAQFSSQGASSPLRSLIAETRLAKSGEIVGSYWVEWRPDALSRTPVSVPSSSATQTGEGQEAAQAEEPTTTAGWRMEGVCKIEGNPVRHFNIHEELLDDDWRVLE
ncbi:hypothetical protein OC844_001457 [Tilletia horrida]|nr:hypothetical protein OC844_001457 [Tilletia horrida]